MNRTTALFSVEDIYRFKQQMLNWANRFSICCFMDNHNYADKYHKYDCIVAAGSYKTFAPEDNILLQLDAFYNENDDWIFGHLNYDLKNEIEELQSSHTNKIGFPDVFFFVPEIVLILENNALSIHSININPEKIFNAINNEIIAGNNVAFNKNIKLQPAFSKQQYLQTVQQLQQHILRGDCYEISFCQEFFSEDISLDVIHTFLKLAKISPTPFSCFYKLNDTYLLCASPERFLSKLNNTVFSQPVKGTAPRGDNKVLDDAEKQKLSTNKKEKIENVMIVDLVRNDLSKICIEGSVHAEELFGIYTFPQVHQMISTIRGDLKPNVSFTEIIQATFPMGSMTGAPKRRAMELIEQYEKTKRQLFSGSVGYISPQKDFDFNVVIRSIFYNASNKYLNYLVGSAITFYADAEKEYEECILKSKAITDTLQ